MKKYLPDTFEEKWTDSWKEDSLFQEVFIDEDVTPENKLFLLFAFSYPSGSGLHVGHVETMVALDILARYYRSIGKKVFFPVGWDSFGLPAENFAIKTGTPPEITTKKAIANFHKQIKRIGISFDWDSEISTSDPDYYRWTQWLFLQLYKKGLAYKKKAPVNWCPSCQTVLANEQVVNGLCERCDNKVLQKEMNQWFFKITDYKDELIEGLEQVDWPKATEEQQRNWIGKSEGASIQFRIANEERDDVIEVFTTRPDTIFGATFLVLAPEHEIIAGILRFAQKDYKETMQHYIEETKKKTEEERKINKEKTGVFTGVYAINPANGEEIPIWIADYVLSGYGTGAIMAVPAHDDRDFAFANKHGIEVVRVIESQEDLPYSHAGKLINSGELTGLDSHKEKEQILAWIEKKGIGTRQTTYKLRDWLISRQRYWGAPIPIVYDPKGEPHEVEEKHLPWLLPTDVEFDPTGESPLRKSKELQARVEKLYGKGWTPEYDTMDTFVDSSWYFLRYTDPRNDTEFASATQMQKWLPVDFYMIGPEHIVLHLLYARFFTKFLRDEKKVTFDEPFLKMRHQGIVMGPDGKRMSKSRGNIINPDDVVAEYGADTIRLYEMFMGPLEADKDWNEKNIQGSYRFLKRIWKYTHQLSDKNEEKSHSVERELNKTIQKVTEDIPELKFNTAIAGMMEFLNFVEKQTMTKDQGERFLKILSPFAPFITEELWQSVLGHKDSIHLSPWPSVDAGMLVEEKVSIPIQVNGKVRATIQVEADRARDKEMVIQLAKDDEQVQKHVSGKEYTVIFVPGKILNFVVRK